MSLRETINSDFEQILSEAEHAATIVFSDGATVRGVLGECTFAFEFEPGTNVAARAFSATFRRDALSGDLPQEGSRAEVDGKAYRVETVRHAYFSALVIVEFSEI